MPENPKPCFSTPVSSLYIASMEQKSNKRLQKPETQDFLYLGSWCTQDRDIRTRKTLAWKSFNKLNKVWSSKLSKRIKIQLFRATTETILLYGSSTWTLTKQVERALDGTYTRMLRKVLNIGWNEKVSNETLYVWFSVQNFQHNQIEQAETCWSRLQRKKHLQLTWQLPGCPRRAMQTEGNPRLHLLTPCWPTHVQALLRNSKQ